MARRDAVGRVVESRRDIVDSIAAVVGGILLDTCGVEACRR